MNTQEISHRICYDVPFFPHHTRDFLRNTLFSRSANRSVHNLVLYSSLLVFVLLWQDVSSFCPIRRYFLLGDKNSIPYHAAVFSTDSLSLRYTALPLPMTVYDICFSLIASHCSSVKSLSQAVSSATLSFGAGVLIMVDHLDSTGWLYVSSTNIVLWL